MKRFIAFLLIISSILTVGCGSNIGESTENGFIDPETGIEYLYCTPMKLYPVDPYDSEDEGEEPDVYITVGEGENKEDFYPVWFEDPSRFLCYEEEGYYFLVHNKDVAEPTVMDFNPIAASIYNSANTAYLFSFYADNEYLPDEKKEHSSTEDSWLCRLIAEYLTTGENVDVPVTVDTIEDHYYIRLLSQDYPGLYYLVSFFSYNGRYFLRDSSTNTTVYCPRDVILNIVGE